MKSLRGIPKLITMFDDASFSQGLPQGELFSLSGGDMLKSRIVKAYWKSRYGKIMRLHNRHDSTDEKITYAFQGGVFIPLVIYDNIKNITKWFDNGKEIELSAFLKKVQTMVHFL